MTSHHDLACFNRESTGRPPATLADLVDLQERGLESGVAIAELQEGKPVSSARNAAIQGWLSWLKDVNQVAGLYVLSSLNDLATNLQGGQLDWVVCNSNSLPRLRRALGSKLGVAVLPSGPGGEPTRILRHQVWSLGRQSNQQQRQLANALVRFSVKPPFQALFSLASSSSVPVNTALPPQLNNQDPTGAGHGPGQPAQPQQPGVQRRHQPPFTAPGADEPGGAASD